MKDNGILNSTYSSLLLTMKDIFCMVNTINKNKSTNHVLGYKVFTLEEVAKMMKVSLKTVYRWVGSKKLRAIKIGHKTYRVLEKDLIKFLNDARG